MLVAALLLSSQGDAPNFAQPVSIDARGWSGKQLTDALTEKTGIRFEARDQATSDRYIVHIENAPLRDAMDRIADAENGEWVRLGPTDYRLIRSAIKVAAAREAAHAELVRKFSVALEAYRKQVAERPDFSDDAAQKLAHDWRHLGSPPTGMTYNSDYWTRQNELEQAIPVGRAFMRVLLTFTPEDLASIPVERKTVFSTSPTSEQRPLPDSAFASLTAMIQEQVIWEDAVAKYLPEQTDQSWNGMATNGRIRSVTNALVSMTRWDANGGIQAQLILSDKKGHIVSEASLSVDEPYDPEKYRLATSKTPEPEIPLSDLNSNLAKFFNYNTFNGRARKPVMTDDSRAILLNPEKYDPLSTFVSEGLIGLAGRRKENLAAVIDERMIGAFANGINKKGMPSQVIDTMKQWGYQSETEGNGWIVIRPKDPDTADEVRCDRHALKVMLDAAMAKGRLLLDDAADYALTSDRFNENPVPLAYLTGLLEKQGAKTLEENDKSLLRFYGSLDPDDRKSTEKISLSHLNLLQMSLIDKMVFGNWSNLQIEQDQTEQTAQVADDQDGAYDGPWNSIIREATVSLGNGIPASGYVQISSNNNHAIIAHMQYGEWDQGYQTYDAGSLGWMIAGKESQSEDNFPWTVIGMRAADRTQISFEFKYTDKVSQSMALQDVLPTSEETGFVEKLPDDLRRELQKSIDEAKKQYAQGGGFRYSGVATNSGPPR